MLKQAHFLFHTDLIDLLSPHRREAEIDIPPNGDQSVKHLIESLGVPHTEVGKVLVNGMQVDFGYLVKEGDQVEVYPSSGAKNENFAQGLPRFILDNHLGRLAVYLRMLGFDALYRNDFQDEELAQVSNREGRILLTRDKRLLMRNLVRQGYWLRSKIPRRQLEEVVRRFGLGAIAQPFKRCVRCNEPLVIVRKEDVLHRLKPLTRQYYDEFRLCPACNQVYWKGSHYQRMCQLIEQVLSNA
jgi:uncharacterized protein with PIN domain